MHSEVTAADPVGLDARYAAGLFAMGTGLLIAGAAIGLNTWPAQQLISAVVGGDGKNLFLAFHGYALVIAVMFWGSRPSPSSQRAVVAGWILCTAGLGYLLRDDLPPGWFDTRLFPAPMFLATTLAIPCLVALAWRCSRPLNASAAPCFEMRLRWIVVLALLFMMVPQPALNLTATVHPLTFDRYALAWDRAAGVSFTPALMQIAQTIPGVEEVLALAYGLTPLGVLAVALLQLRHRPPHVASALLVWVVLTSCALVAYHGFPITGPKYAFASEGLRVALDRSYQHPVELLMVAPYPRNGMPSMHFGWLLAASILWWRSGTRMWSRALLIGLTSLTGIAALQNGEHYAVDLIVAVPFVLAAIGLSTTGVPWQHHQRRAVVFIGFGAWLVWVLLLRWQIALFVSYPALCWLMILATAGVVIYQARCMARFEALATTESTPRSLPLPVSSRARSLQLRVGMMFFFSGAAALTYQVLFAKQLALVFGSTATATFTVLATFLGGMALGSLAGGLLAQRTKRSVIAYALIEIAIGVYCIATPAIFDTIQQVYVALAMGTPPDAQWLTALRVMLGAGALLVPTMLMGMTLPLLAQTMGAGEQRMGARVAWLYFVNTAGAALGALVTAYFVIRILGAHRTTLMAAALNFIVALAALRLSDQNRPDTPAPVTRRTPVQVRVYAPRARFLAFAVLGLGGVLSLGLEVVYVHLLSIVAGNSVYAFGLMLATFLLGLSLGGEVARRWMSRHDADSMLALGVALTGLGVLVALSSGLWNSIPDYFAGFAGYPAATGFAVREAIRGLVCALVMVPPTLLIGASYAFAMDVATSGFSESYHRLGAASAINTAGNIVGVLLFGFLILPKTGGLGASRIIAASAVALGGLAMMTTSSLTFKRRVAIVVAGGMLVFFGQGAQLDYQRLSSGANVYFFPQQWGRVIDHAESIDGGLTTVTETGTADRRVKILLTNGKFQGNDAISGEMQAQIGFAVAPLLHTDRRERALVIGYGTGVTSRVLHEAGFRRLEIAELSADIVTMADRHFGVVNRQVSSAPGVTLHVTDGRNLLLLGDSRYDLISIEISSIWFAGAAALYNREFYRLAKRRLAADGVLQQWIQLHRLDPADILSVVATVRSEFRYVSLYVIGRQGILVATDAPEHRMPTAKAIDTLHRQEGLAEVRRIAGRDFAAFARDLLLTPEALDCFIDRYGFDPAWLASTDNNLRLEYSTPRANVNDPGKSYVRNIEMLRGIADAKGGCGA